MVLWLFSLTYFPEFYIIWYSGGDMKNFEIWYKELMELFSGELILSDKSEYISLWYSGKTPSEIFLGEKYGFARTKTKSW